MESGKRHAAGTQNFVSQRSLASVREASLPGVSRLANGRLGLEPTQLPRVLNELALNAPGRSPTTMRNETRSNGSGEKPTKRCRRGASIVLGLALQ
jgi:hypothetical protein